MININLLLNAEETRFSLLYKSSKTDDVITNIIPRFFSTEFMSLMGYMIGMLIHLKMLPTAYFL